MSIDVTTIGDAMRDIFIFPSLEEMEKPVTDEKIKSSQSFDKYLVFGLGDKITVSDVEFSIGGTAANVAAGIAKIGLKSRIISAVGGDNTGTEVVNCLKKAKVDTSTIKVYKNKKSSFSIIVSYKGERTIFVYHAYSPENFSIPPNLQTSWFYLGPMAKGYERIFNQIVNLVVKNNIKVAINPGSVQIGKGLRSFGGLLKLIDIIFLNREEAQELSGLPGTPKIKDTAKIIQLAGPKMVVITDGKEGAYVYTEEDFFKIGVYPGTRVEATGAGDSFASGFLGSIIKGQSIRESLKWGVINSASVIEQVGAQEGLLGLQVIKKKAKKYRWPADTMRFS